MAFQSSRLSSLWTNIVRVSNNSGTLGAYTTTVYMVRRNFTAVQWRNNQYITTLTRTQQLLSVQKMIEQPANLMGQFAKKASNTYDADECGLKKPRDTSEETSSFKVISSDNSVIGSVCDDSPKATPTKSSVYPKGVQDGGGGKTASNVPASGFCAGIAKEEPKPESADDSKKSFAPPEVKLPDRQQVEKYFFRSLAFIYDVAITIINWVRKVICRYIIMNDKVQAHWQNLRNKMEDSKRN